MKNGLGVCDRFYDAVTDGCVSAFPGGSADHCPSIMMHVQQVQA